MSKHVPIRPARNRCFDFAQHERMEGGHAFLGTGGIIYGFSTSLETNGGYCACVNDAIFGRLLPFVLSEVEAAFGACASTSLSTNGGGRALAE